MSNDGGRLPSRIVAALALVVVLASCSSGPEPAPMPSAAPEASESATPSPTPTAKASPTPPVLPPAATGTSPASAKAFVRHWVATLNYSGRTGDTTELADISAMDCKSCVGVVEYIKQVYRASGRISGRGWSINTMKYQPLQPRELPVLSVGVQIAPQRVTREENAAVEHFEGGKRSMLFRLSARNDRWQVIEVDQAL